MAFHGFGSGIIWGTPLTDGAGVAVANPTPVLFGTLQDVSVDISRDVKMLYGRSQFAVDLGDGKGKIGGKAKFAQVNGAILNSLFFGQTVAAGIVASYIDQIGALIPATPFTITPTPPGSGAWAQDLGVRDSNGVPMTCVASAPATGQYTVTAGAYLFAAADTGKTVYISYGYTATSTTAKKSTVVNTLMGTALKWRADLFVPRGSSGLNLTLFACMSSKLQIATKQDDFLIPELDFESSADSVGRVLQWGTPE